MKPELKKLLLLNLPYLLFVYLFAKCGQAYRLAAGADASAKLLHLTSGISAAFANPLPSLHPFDLCVGVVGAVAVRLIVYSKGKNAKKYRKGEEYGSARWGTAKDIAPYIDPKFENNILLTQTERLTMTGRPKDPKTARNKNVLVIGGSGSGKTRFYVKPNLMQCFPTSDYPTSFVVTDPKGTLVLETGQMFQRAGYRVKILNTINFSKSMKYNPFVYIHSEKDVLKLVNTLIANTKGEGEKSAEDFWVKSERLFYTALIGYIWYEAPAEEMNFTTLLEMINASEAREDDPEFQSPVDLMFERLEQKDRWNLWNYYTLGKLTHYVADAFTFPHNEHWPDSLASHHVYETQLRIYLAEHLREYAFPDCSAEQLDLIPALEALHRQYLESRNSDLSRDTRFIVEATGLLMRCCPVG